MRLGALVQEYVRAQCDVLLEARRAIAHRDETIVHPARVAIRRLRATLRTFRSVYTAAERDRFRAELSWAGGLLGEVRDLQVLEERFAPTAAADATLHRVIQDQLEHDRSAAWDAATRALDSERGDSFFVAVQLWRDAPPFSDEPMPKAAHAKKRVRKAAERLQVRLDRVREAVDAGDSDAARLLHEARKAGKRHRYAVELAAGVLGDSAPKQIERARELQDVLGAHQDAVVALAYLRRIDAAEPPEGAAAGLETMIAQTRDSAEDVRGALSEANRLQG